MDSIWIPDKQCEKALLRNEAFWKGELEDYPLIWVTVPNAKGGRSLPLPPDPQKIWTDIDYVMASADAQLSQTHYAGDSLPVFNPWMGPDQLASWLGAETELRPDHNTAWVEPFVDEWRKFPKFEIAASNKYWQIYLDTVKASVQVGKGKWITAYPDLHTGIDGLAAIRGRENLLMDMITGPGDIHNAMKQMTELWKYVVDIVSDIVLPAGQGTSNWTMGWSKKRFLCIGQNDTSCMISPQMFDDFCWHDTVECCNHVDYSLYHLDGPTALIHLSKILELQRLHTVQWIQGAGNPPPSKWLPVLQQIQKSGKSVQLLYYFNHGDGVDLREEIEILCSNLDPTKLFFHITTLATIAEADAIVEYTLQICRK